MYIYKLRKKWFELKEKKVYKLTLKILREH